MLGNAVVAFSGGVDSSLLLFEAHQALGDKVVAVTARSATYPEREYVHAVDFARKLGVRHETIISEELDIEGFSDNPRNRCYLCKKELFQKIWVIAQQYGFNNVLEGSNFDDLSDYRPGLKAVSELGIISPLRDAGLTKDNIRQLSKLAGLDTWNKPSFACLSSRFPYGHRISPEKLIMVDKAEQFLIDSGFSQVRVRHHGDTARIELIPGEMPKILEQSFSEKVYDYFRQLGFTYVSLDLKGYRTGSMNETQLKPEVENTDGKQ